MTGCHVHIQAPKKPKQLANLAYMLVIFESEINKFHPPCRQPRTKEAMENYGSCRMNLRNAEKMAAMDEVDIYETVEMDPDVSPINMLSLVEIWAKFLGASKSTDPRRSISALLSSRGKACLYSLVNRLGTIEFRQHCGK